MHRRDFLHGMGAGFFAVSAGYVPMARASCGGLATPYRILEINLSGGLSAFDTLLHAYNYYTAPAAMEIAQDLVNDIYANFNANPGLINSVPLSGVLSASTQALGPLNTAPFANRWRVVCMGHGFEPHPVAIPYGLTGTTQGRQYHSGMGAWIKDCNVGEPSYIFYTQPVVGTAMVAANINGLGGAASPVLVPWSDGSADTNIFSRTPKTRDRVVNALRDQYEERLQFNAGVRSSAYQAYTSSREILVDAENTIRGKLDAAAATATSPVEAAVRTAIRMLNGNADTRYICVVDTGYDTHGHPAQADAGSNGADTHGAHHRGRLADALAGLDEPGLDLDEVMIIVTTEFGRSKMAASVNGDIPDSNSSHWPHGYAQLVIGGEVGDGVTGMQKRLAGIIDANGYARKSVNGDLGYTPAEFRTAMLYAAGIDVSLDNKLGLYPNVAASNLYDSIVKN